MQNSYTIKETEALTGISSQNIRFYERQGLLTPKRNRANGYRQYTDADIHTLKLIRLLRMLDMPLEEIHAVLSEEKSLAQAVLAQQIRLKAQAQELADAIALCGRLAENDVLLGTLDVDAQLAQAQTGTFGNRWLSDWKSVGRAAHENSFVFYPDDAVTNSAEFSAALRAYAKAEEQELIITKECMYPEFTLDGIRYTAQRNYTSMGHVPTACIYCERVDPIVPNVPAGRRRVLDFLHRSWPQILLLVIILISLLPQLPGMWVESPLGTILILVTACILVWVSTFRNRLFTFNEKHISEKNH